MRLRGGIRVRLAVGVLVVVCGALFAAYLIVVPSLEKRLVDAKLAELQRNATTIAAEYATRDFREPLSLDSFARGAAFAFDARVSVFEVIGPPVSVSSLADSADVEINAMARDRIALATASTGRAARGRVKRAGREYAEVAAPLAGAGRVLLLSASLGDQLSTVHLVQRRLLYASLAAFLIALALGSAAAASHARRIRRLERAAERIAEGTFDEPVVDAGDDELGELARTFDRMRIQLAQLDSARRAFVAHASHELRTPLFALGGFLELLEDEDVDDETRRSFLATMHEQVQRLTKLTTDLLDLSRIDAGGMRVEHEDVSIAEVARTVDELRGLAEGREQQLESSAADAWAWGDEERVLQIARALVGNALLHTPAGTRVVVRSSPGAGVARLEVEDDGPGISSDETRRIFDRFYRVEEGRASGSGLGLAIARELAERMGGSVRVSSRPGRTVFTLELDSADPARELVPS